MIGYVTLGSNDIAREAGFYDELLKLVGAGRFMESDRFVAWSDEGAPGPRGASGFYAAYFRDLDGNKLNAFCMQAASAG